MSETNVEIARRGFDAFATMDMDAFVADWHPDLVWDVHGYEEWPGARTGYKGPPEILAEFANFMGSARALEVNDLEVTGLDDDRVLATYAERRLNEGDSSPIQLDIGIVYELTKATPGSRSTPCTTRPVAPPASPADSSGSAGG